MVEVIHPYEYFEEEEEDIDDDDGDDGGEYKEKNQYRKETTTESEVQTRNKQQEQEEEEEAEENINEIPLMEVGEILPTNPEVPVDLSFLDGMKETGDCSYVKVPLYDPREDFWNIIHS